MASAKVENYSAEQTAKVVELYEAGKGMSVEQIAEAVGKSARSVIAKLSREGVYVAKSGASKAKRVTKADLVAKISAALGVDVAVFESFEKASHDALETLAAHLVVTAQAEYDALDA